MKQLAKRFIFRIYMYAVLLAFTFLGFRLIFDFFDLVYTNIDNSRYFLSAIAQSQAAIIAIVITVSLVAVQLGASAYSPRVVNIFKSNPDLWVLMVLYGGSLSYDVFMLKILNEATSEFYIFVAYWLCASALLVLFPYVLSIMNVLNPQAVIRRLLEDMRPPDIRRVPESEDWEPWKGGDPFQPVVDIVRGAFMKYDYETIRIGLRGMTAKVIGVNYDVADNYIGEYRLISWSGYRGGRAVPDKSDWKPSKELSKYYCRDLNQIGRLFAEKDEVLALETIMNLRAVAEVMTEKKLGTEEYVVEALGSIGEISAQKELKRVTEESMDTISYIVESLPCERYMKTFPNGTKYAYPYGNIIEAAVGALSKIGVLAVKKLGLYELQDVGRSVEKAGIAMARGGLVNKWRIIIVADTFREIGIIALNAEKNPSQVEDFILYDYVIRPLTTIGKIAYEKGMLPSEKGVVSGFSRAVFAIWELGIYATIRDFNMAASESAKALAELTILDGEVVKEELNRLKRRETDIESLTKFREFMDAYKEHVKKLIESEDCNQKE